MQATTARPARPRASAEPHRSRADEVYEQLKRDVAAFKLVPGDRFTENEISERLGVSRTPVRQALFRLQQEGYVEVLFRSGWRVLPFDFEQFEQLYDLRMVLETTAVHRICTDDRRVDQALLAQLAAIWLVPASERSTDAVQVAQWDEAFHCARIEDAAIEGRSRGALEPRCRGAIADHVGPGASAQGEPADHTTGGAGEEAQDLGPGALAVDDRRGRPGHGDEP